MFITNSRKKWILNDYTTNKSNLKKGDQVLFYVAGQHRQKIIANSVLSSKLKKDNDELRFLSS